MSEVWKDIKDVRPVFEVSNLGNIRHKRNGLIRKLKTNRSGYRQIELRINKQKKTHSVHRLVAIAFIRNPKNKPCINHKDGNKANNLVSNLEWATYTDNLCHAYKIGLRKKEQLRSGKIKFNHNSK